MKKCKRNPKSGRPVKAKKKTAKRGIKVHPIRDQEWWGLAGSTPFADGSRPLVGYGKLKDGREYTIVISGCDDGEGVSFMGTDYGDLAESPNNWAYTKEIKFGCQEKAVKYAAQLKVESIGDLKDAGFKRQL